MITNVFKKLYGGYIKHQINRIENDIIAATYTHWLITKYEEPSEMKRMLRKANGLLNSLTDRKNNLTAKLQSLGV